MKYAKLAFSSKERSSVRDIFEKLMWTCQTETCYLWQKPINLDDFLVHSCKTLIEKEKEEKLIAESVSVEINEREK